MQGLKVIFAIDRAGLVGNDGESHQGILDTSFLNSVPGMTVLAPTYYSELESMLYSALYKLNGAVAIRYPRGREGVKPEDYEYQHESYSFFGSEDAKTCIISYGREFSECYSAYRELDGVSLIKLNSIKPIDVNCLNHLKAVKNVYFFEESIKAGSVGERFGSLLAENGIKCNYHHIAVDDVFVKQAEVSRQLELFGLDKESIINEVSNGR